MGDLDGKGWYCRGIIRDNLTGDIKEQMDIPAPTKEHLFSDEYIQRCINADWDEYHIIPADDSIEHEISMDCPCIPDVKFFEAKLITHEAQDGRQVLEWFDKVINPE